MKTLRLVTLVAAMLMAGAGLGFSSPVGVWVAKDGARIRISACGKGMCGFIASAPNDPATGRPPVDKNNPDPGKRNRSLVGIETLISMQPNGPAKWSGRLYNDDDGMFYPGNLIELGPTTIRIEGCSGSICGGDELTRLK